MKNSLIFRKILILINNQLYQLGLRAHTNLIKKKIKLNNLIINLISKKKYLL